MNHSRLKTVYLTIILCYVAVVAKLFYWQIIKYPEFSKKNTNQNYQPSAISPKKGRIYDSSDSPLALNQTFYQLSIYKPDLKTPLEKLIEVTGSDDPQLIKFIQNPSQKWLTLKNTYDYDKKSTLIDPGFTFTSAQRRSYPEADLAKNILNGLDTYYYRQLAGKPGFVWETVDATGKTILSKSGWYIEAIDGRDLHTSINRRVQAIIEKELADGIKNYSADSGSITIMAPASGAIIAMANFPATSSASTASLFEPGSIFKPLVMAMALDSNSISSNFICTKCHSPHQIGQYAISNWDNTFHANSDLKDIIKNSDNIGMSYIIDQVGLSKFLRYFQLLNLDRKVGIDLPGEARPVSKNYWPEIDLATASFGQGFAITQIQMLAAFNTIANNGLLVKPNLVQAFGIGESIIPAVKTKPVKVYRPNTISEMKNILKYSVENGVVAKFKPDNLEVCAKSGTSQVAVVGGYSDSSTIASYIGFSPCLNPKFTMIVTINNPRTSPWGSSTAAPVWYKLAAEILPLL